MVIKFGFYSPFYMTTIRIGLDLVRCPHMGIKMSTLNFIKPDNTVNANDDEYEFGMSMSSVETTVEGDYDVNTIKPQ